MSARAFTIRAHGALWTRGERELALRAVAIADQAMAELLRAHCLPASGLPQGIVDAFVPCAAGERVRRVDASDAGVIRAFTYLYDRGLARIVTTAAGDQVIVLTRGES